MKKLLLLFFLLTSFQSFSQQPFAPPGAVWHYDFWAVGSGGFVKIEYHSDSTIQGIQTKKLEMTRYRWYATGPGTIGLEISQLPPAFVFQNGDTVFWYSMNTFRVLYNFNAVPGDMWIVTESMALNSSPYCDSLSVVRVDSIGTDTINGEVLRYLSVMPDTGSPHGFWQRIYERLGSRIFLFPETAGCDSMIYDGPMYHLHCYEDDMFPLFNADTNDCEWWWVLSTDKNIHAGNAFNVFPNPASDEILVDCRHEVKSFAIWNISGEKVMERKINSWISSYRIDLSDLSPGLFLISAETNAGQLTKRFVKQ